MSTMHRHFILHKPSGYLSQFVNNQSKRRNKKLLGELFPFPEDAMAIGRLDEASEGLLFLTTDGSMSEEVRSRKVEKEYYAQVDGVPDVKSLDQLSKGVRITVHGKPYTTLPCAVKALESPPEFPWNNHQERHPKHGPTSWIALTLREGKFRQVRKMTSAVGFPTLRLVRVRIGEIHLGDQRPGEVREVDHFNLP